MKRVTFSVSKWGVFGALVVVLSVSQVNADIITPVGATATSEFGLGSDTSDLISGSGLTGADASATHDADEANMWISGCPNAGVPGGSPEEAGEVCADNPFAAPLVEEQILEFELDTAYDLDSLLLWQYNRADLLARGPTIVDVLVSPTLDGAFTNVNNYALSVGGGTDESAQVLNLGGLDGTNAVRRVRIVILANGGDGYAGLSEVRFDGVALAANVIPGDVDGSNNTDFNDALSLLGYIFLGNPSDVAGCTDAGSTVAIGDYNGDGAAGMSDALAQLRAEFVGGPGHALGGSCQFFFSCSQICQ